MDRAKEAKTATTTASIIVNWEIKKEKKQWRKRVSTLTFEFRFLLICFECKYISHICVAKADPQLFIEYSLTHIRYCFFFFFTRWIKNDFIDVSNKILAYERLIGILCKHIKLTPLQKKKLNAATVNWMEEIERPKQMRQIKIDMDQIEAIDICDEYKIVLAVSAECVPTFESISYVDKTDTCSKLACSVHSLCCMHLFNNSKMCDNWINSQPILLH